jgi:hypothetical protein
MQARTLKHRLFSGAGTEDGTPTARMKPIRADQNEWESMTGFEERTGPLGPALFSSVLSHWGFFTAANCPHYT